MEPSKPFNLFESSDLFQDSSYCEQPVDATLAGKYKNRAEVRLVSKLLSSVTPGFHIYHMGAWEPHLPTRLI